MTEVDLLLTTEWGKHWHSLLPSVTHSTTPLQPSPMSQELISSSPSPSSLLSPVSAERLPPRVVSSASPSSIGSPVVAKLAAQLHLRYHFAAHHDAYFELPPYKNHSPHPT